MISFLCRLKSESSNSARQMYCRDDSNVSISHSWLVLARFRSLYAILHDLTFALQLQPSDDGRFQAFFEREAHQQFAYF